VVRTVTKTVTKISSSFNRIKSNLMNINAKKTANGVGGIRLPYAVQLCELQLVTGYLK
jgi:hypothetical protein